MKDRGENGFLKLLLVVFQAETAKNLRDFLGRFEGFYLKIYFEIFLRPYVTLFKREGNFKSGGDIDNCITRSSFILQFSICLTAIKSVINHAVIHKKSVAQTIISVSSGNIALFLIFYSLMFILNPREDKTFYQF
jgi:hypothetical protein